MTPAERLRRHVLLMAVIDRLEQACGAKSMPPTIVRNVFLEGAHE